MTITDQLRDLLKRAAAPLNMDQIMEQLPALKRESVAALLSQRKKAGEFIACIENGRACYAIAEGHRSSPKAAPKRFDKPAGSDSSAASEPTTPTTPLACDATPPSEAPNRPLARRPGNKKGPSEQSQVEKLRHAVAAAEAAREAYIDPLVDARFYAWLQESVRASREALAMFERGAA